MLLFVWVDEMIRDFCFFFLCYYTVCYTMFKKKLYICWIYFSKCKNSLFITHGQNTAFFKINNYLGLKIWDKWEVLAKIERIKEEINSLCLRLPCFRILMWKNLPSRFADLKFPKDKLSRKRPKNAKVSAREVKKFFHD